MPEKLPIAIIGGGLAGLAAAVGLVDCGWPVELLESRRRLGGRATSFRDAATGTLIDHCQHVSLGCCTNLADFCRRTGLAELLDTHGTLHFIGPAGERCDVRAARWLPAPLHLLPSLLRLNYLSWRERFGIVRAMRRLAKQATIKNSAEISIKQWLVREGQSARAIELFWTPVIVSALSETVDNAAVEPVRKVFVDAFLGQREAYAMHVPRVPLGEFYGQRLQHWLQERGVRIQLESNVRSLRGDASGVRQIVLGDNELRDVAAAIVAVPWRRVPELLDNGLTAALPEVARLEKIESAPISAVHLWFDRPISDVPHAVLPGRLSQWMFARGEQAAGHYYQVVISASRELDGRPRESIVDEVRQELAAIWPVAREATLRQSRVITEQHAVFSVRPDLENLRPTQTTSVRNLFLAGDWTSTGWPATMEGAVRSGYLAAEAVCKCFQQPRMLLQPDLPRPWITKFLIGSA